jgi:hypothetical protein
MNMYLNKHYLRKWIFEEKIMFSNISAVNSMELNWSVSSKTYFGVVLYFISLMVFLQYTVNTGGCIGSRSRIKPSSWNNNCSFFNCKTSIIQTAQIKSHLSEVQLRYLIPNSTFAYFPCLSRIYPLAYTTSHDTIPKNPMLSRPRMTVILKKMATGTSVYMCL